jgi:hypothetical protein
MLPDWTVVGFTGHRSIANPGAVAGQVAVALDDLAATNPSLLLISSIAAGADTLFVNEAARRGIPYLLVLPFPAARFQHDFAPGEWLARSPLLEKAAHVEEISGSASDEEAYMDAGARIVNQSDLLVAVWDGTPTSGLGGTADVVGYARDLGKPVLWLNPVSGMTTRERFDRLPAVQPALPAVAPRQAVEEHFGELDAAASRGAPNVRHLLQRIVLLHLLASVLGLTALALHIEGRAGFAIAVLEVLLLATALLLTARHHHAHKEWMRSRIEAELCRSFLATWPLRARIDRSPRLALRGFERLVRNLRLLQLLDRGAGPSLESARAQYLENRVMDQVRYFGRRCGEATRAYRGLTRLAMISTALAALLAAGHLGLEIMHIDGPALPATELLSLVLPLVSAALLSLVLTQEHSRRASRYGEMVGLLEDAARRLAAARTWTGVARVANETEEALLTEAVEWQAFRRFASQTH